MSYQYRSYQKVGYIHMSFQSCQRVGYGHRCFTKLAKRVGYGTATCTRIRTRPGYFTRAVPGTRAFSSGSTELIKCRVRIWMSYRTYQSVGYGYVRRTELTEVSGTGMEVVPSSIKCRVRVIQGLYTSCVHAGTNLTENNSSSRRVTRRQGM